MELKNIRYNFEHKVLPHFLYNCQAEFIKLVSKGSQFFYETLNSMIGDDSTKNPYKKEEFVVTPFRVTGEVSGFAVTLPAPEEAPLCYAIYILVQENCEKSFYFTVEKSNGQDQCLCGWDKEGIHMNFGSCEQNQSEIMKQCTEIFLCNGFVLPDDIMEVIKRR